MNLKHVVFAIVLLVLAGCASPTPMEIPSTAIQPEKYLEEPLCCEQDTDCLCKGVNIKGNMCFVGNKYYYQEFIDKDSECPAKEFCTGYDADVPHVSRCFGYECIQMPECHYDYECKEGKKCVEFKCE